MSNVLNESAENYLETILILSQKLPVVRSVDIANELGFKKSSVSVAMKNLREKEHIKVDEQGFIHLTPSGLEIANMIYERHTLLSSWLIHLGVPADVAAADACKMEHVISQETFDAIKRHVHGSDQETCIREQGSVNHPFRFIFFLYYEILFFHCILKES